MQINHQTRTVQAIHKNPQEKQNIQTLAYATPTLLIANIIVIFQSIKIKITARIIKLAYYHYVNYNTLLYSRGELWNLFLVIIHL